ncbi:MAG: SIS domain-containing protein [Rhodospirillales bacterium]|nr:SIS domain-containing protein [Rhodospirillales bacterium]
MGQNEPTDFATYAKRVAQYFEIAATVLDDDVARAIEIVLAAMRAGGKAIFCGNGGSAADSQHLSAELVGRYLVDRDPLPALALSVDTSALTAIGNDYGFDQVFARQLRGVGRAGDVLIAMSTSGNSRNVIAAIEAAQHMRIATIGFTGAGGGAVADRCDLAIRVPATQTNHVQELHIAIGHYLCGRVESALR